MFEFFARNSAFTVSAFFVIGVVALGILCMCTGLEISGAIAIGAKIWFSRLVTT